MKKNDRVRIEARHDLNHGEEGVVVEVKEHTATVKLDNGLVLLYGLDCLVPIS